MQYPDDALRAVLLEALTTTFAFVKSEVLLLTPTEVPTVVRAVNKYRKPDEFFGAFRAAWNDVQRLVYALTGTEEGAGTGDEAERWQLEKDALLAMDDRAQRSLLAHLRTAVAYFDNLGAEHKALLSLVPAIAFNLDLVAGLGHHCATFKRR